MLVEILSKEYIFVDDIYDIYVKKSELIEHYFDDVLSFRKLSLINSLFEYLIDKIIELDRIKKYSHISPNYRDKLLEECEYNMEKYRKKLQYILDVGSPCIMEEKNNDMDDIDIYDEKLVDDFPYYTEYD